MNTFILSTDPVESARFHCNKHVVKMILESAQMLCAAHWLHLLKSKNKNLKSFKRIRDAQVWLYENTDKSFHPPWKMTHVNHPCTVWTSENISNYLWQLKLCKSLINEYKIRYNKNHKVEDVVKWLTKNVPIQIKNEELTNFPICMDQKYIISIQGIPDPVLSYRNYYLKDKIRFAKWEPQTNIPKWFSEGIKNE